MLGLKSDRNTKNLKKINLLKDYPCFYTNIYLKVQKSVDDFFQKYFKLRFIGLSTEDNIFFYGDEYFVNKIPVNKQSAIEVRLSADAVSAFLDNAIGSSEEKFRLNNLTDIEAMLLKAYTVYIFECIQDSINTAELNRKLLQNSRKYNFTFYVHSDREHIGKIILTIPECIISEMKEVLPVGNYSISDFPKAIVNVNLAVGKAKITLEEIKALESGDIIVLDESNINIMAVLVNGMEIKFKINPNPSLIISVDNNRGDEMEEETGAKSQNMWDSILVDIVAEFNNVKLTLGELKQISEGLVIDIGSVYDNQIRLRVENQVVASGELVILNDRYGVRINEVLKSKEHTKPEEQKSTAPVDNLPAQKPAGTPAQKPAGTPAQKPGMPPKKLAAKPAQPQAKGDENFDYSDFEIEDESI